MVLEKMPLLNLFVFVLVIQFAFSKEKNGLNCILLCDFFQIPCTINKNMLGERKIRQSKREVMGSVAL